MAKNICGDFDFSEMNERAILKKALNSLNITIDNETTGEMKAMIKAYNSTAKVELVQMMAALMIPLNLPLTMDL